VRLAPPSGGRHRKRRDDPLCQHPTGVPLERHNRNPTGSDCVTLDPLARKGEPFDAHVDNGKYGAGNVVVRGYFAISLRNALGSAPQDVKHIYLRAVASEMVGQSRRPSPVPPRRCLWPDVHAAAAHLEWRGSRSRFQARVFEAAPLLSIAISPLPDRRSGREGDPFRREWVLRRPPDPSLQPVFACVRSVLWPPVGPSTLAPSSSGASRASREPIEASSPSTRRLSWMTTRICSDREGEGCAGAIQRAFEVGNAQL
jgi:hypothetical protein